MGNVRLIPRLDIKGPNVVKGIQFDGFRVLGTAEMFAEFYYAAGADEIIYQDTVASLYQRPIQLDIVRKTASKLFVPLTVAGGIRTVSDIREILRAGADKVAINTGAVLNPELLGEAVKMFGSQCIVASIETHKNPDGKYEVWTDYGRQPTGIEAYEWAKRVVDLGVGEIMLTSIDREGTGRGYDLDLISRFSKTLPVPVIACGGAGSSDDLVAAAKDAGADAVSAASVFHHHYLRVSDESVALKNRYEHRMGKELDTGNVDFLHLGYGGFREIQVKPTSIEGAKKAMLERGLMIRFEPGRGRKDV